VTRRDSKITTPMRACPNLECNEEDDLETRQVMSGVHVVCRGCSMRGPGAESIVGAVEMWNELPRLE
jgi:hypothetical protein